MRSSIRRLLILIVSMAIFMEAVDATILNTAIPAISKSLHVNPLSLKSALISYLMSLAIFIPISGWISDKFGNKKTFITAIIIFTLSSFWCGWAHSVTELSIARGIQGLGGSLMVPVGRLIIARTFPRHQFIRIFNQIIIIVSFGPMLGPLIGGVITHHFSWHWIFWINIPLGILLILLVSFFMKNDLPKEVPPFDKIGFLLFGSSLATITFGLSSVSENPHHQLLSLYLIVLSFILIGFYLFYSRSKPHPIVNKSLFKIRTFRISILGNFLGRLSFSGGGFLIPLMLQMTLGCSPQTSGLLVMPFGFGIFFTKMFAKKLIEKIGFKSLLLANTLFIALAFTSFYWLHPPVSLISIGVISFILGVVISLQFSGMNPLAYSKVPDSILNSATSIISTNAQLSQSFAIAMSVLILKFYSNVAHGLTFTAFQNTFLTLGLLTLPSILVFIKLKPVDGRELLQKTRA